MKRSVKNFTFTFTSFIASTLNAQPFTPPPMQQCMNSNSVTFIEELTPAQHDYFWNETKRHANGYFEINVDEGYFEVIEKFSRKIQNQISHNKKANDSISLIGEFTESSARKTFIYSTPTGKAMLTRWNFVLDGAKICIPSIFMNENIFGSRASISLARTNASVKCTWKANWILNNQQYEFYLDDVCHEEYPTVSKVGFLKVLTEAVNLTSK